jgi:hypothetical protein
MAAHHTFVIMQNVVGCWVTSYTAAPQAGGGPSAVCRVRWSEPHDKKRTLFAQPPPKATVAAIMGPMANGNRRDVSSQSELAVAVRPQRSTGFFRAMSQCTKVVGAGT